MENQHIKNIRKWLYLLAIFTGFSIQTGFSNPPSPTPDPLPGSSAGIDPVVFIFNCIDGEPGDTICIPVTVENFNEIVIAQLEILWDSDVLDYIEITNPGTPFINVNSDFNLSGPNALKFIPLGFPLNGETLPDGTTLFEICFRIIGVPGSTSCVGISPYFTFEVADADTGVIPSDSVNCCMNVENAMNLVGFITSCGPAVAGNNGTIDLTVYGGMAPYTVIWMNTVNGNTSLPIPIPVEGGSNVLNVPSGNYNIIITDALGNMVIYNIDVSDLALGITTHLRHPTCYKFENGTIWIKPEGGTQPYSFIWESLTVPNLAGSGFIRDAGDSSLVTSLPDGMYRILVEDSTGCEVEITVILNDNPYVFTVDDLINATCVGSGDGVIDFTISGATPDMDGNYTITWPFFQVTDNSISIGLLNPGEYSITVTDEVPQCDTVITFIIGYTDTITANITVTDPPCAGSNNGSVSIHGLTNGVSGPSYSYTIYENGIQITTQVDIGGNFNYSPLGAGDYVAIVEEGSCLSDSIHFTLIEPLPLMVTAEGTRPDNCIPTPSGDIWFEITNGTGPYILSAGAGTQDGDTLLNLNAGNYTLTVTDQTTGCTATLPFTIHDGDDNEEADITFQIDGTPCEGGTVTVLYQGGPIPPGVGVLWSTGEVNDTITIEQTDTLSVDILLGAPIFCILDDTVHIQCIEKLDLDITVMHPACGEGAVGGPFTGTVIVDTANATAPVTWYWSFPDTTTSGIYSGLAPGKYYVTVTDAADSIAIDSFEIIAPNTLHLQFSNVDSTSCPDACDGATRVVPADGDPTLDYFLYWDPVNPQGDTGLFFNITDLCAGLNIFTVSQDGLCFYEDTIEIFAPPPIVVDLVQSLDVSCHSGNDGLIEVIASGGTPGYFYDWVGGPTSAVYNNLEAGMHHIVVTDANNCMQEDSFSITQPDTLIADIDSSGTLNLSCGGSNDGIITLEVSGGNPGDYTYTWNPNVSDLYQAVNLPAGHYTVTVSDPLGCSDTASYTLTSPIPITVTWPEVVQPACFGDETVLLIEDVSGGNGNYTFTINGGEVHDIGDPVMIPSGIYVVTVFDDRGCSADTTYIVMEPNPIIVSIGPDDPVIDLGDSLYITGTVDQSDNPILMTLWTSAEPLSCATCEGTWVYNSVPAEYIWTVTDVNGCTGSASILVDVDYDRDVFFPNIFSPNGDGRNDEFKIFTGPGVVTINYLNIYDRWGNLIHSESDLLPNPDGAGSWDGTSGGDELNPGVFVFVAEVTFIDNNTTLRYSGDVTLIR